MWLTLPDTGQSLSVLLSPDRWGVLGTRPQERCATHFGVERMIRVFANQGRIFKNMKGCCKEEGSIFFSLPMAVLKITSREICQK